MPELPEVESLILGLKKEIIKSKIKDLTIINKKIISQIKDRKNKRKIQEEDIKIKKIINKKIKNIHRIAKNIIITLGDDSVLLIHLKMTGQLVFKNTLTKEKIIGGHPILKSFLSQLPNKHTKIIFHLNNGDLFYNDVRGFGHVLYFENEKCAEYKKHFKNTSIDPFDKNFSLKYFEKKLKNNNKKIKTIFLAQSVVNGLGNIYSDEVCFESKILPSRIGKNLKKEEVKILFKNIKKILKSAIKFGGSSISDYLLSDGTKGNFAKYHKVYGKKICPACNLFLEKIKISGRTTKYCKKCQK